MDGAAGDRAEGPGDGRRYVSRGGLKLRAALDHFGIDPTGWWCVDLGASTGGFTDCLLRAGAARVVSVDTAYGEFAWTLRNDARVTVVERTNALHAVVPVAVAERGGVELAVIDLGWTPQRLALPAAARWLRPGGRVVTLVKPHYEVARSELGAGGVLGEERAAEVVREVEAGCGAWGFRSVGVVRSPVLGGAAGKKGKGTGNAEWLMLAEPVSGGR